MTCESCTKAQADPRSGEFMLRCNECQTRQLAHGFAFWERRLQPDAYRSALARVTRDGETPKEAHARVLAWHERIKLAHDTAPVTQ